MIWYELSGQTCEGESRQTFNYLYVRYQGIRYEMTHNADNDWLMKRWKEWLGKCSGHPIHHFIQFIENLKGSQEVFRILKIK